MTNDLRLLHQMEQAAAAARLEMLRDPGVFMRLTLAPACPDMPCYWAILDDLRYQIRSAAAAQWEQIEISGEWRAAADLARRYACALLALARLALAGHLRRLGLVDVCDPVACLCAIARL